jgi:glutamate/tyrosine decarboxylase-like PLP-dependent enzyme
MNRFAAFLPLLKKAVNELDDWRMSFGEEPGDEPDQSIFRDMEKKLPELITRLKGNYPFHHPSYAGQMLKPPHPAAWLAYSLAMSINPNNHALDGGPPTSEMEKCVMADLADMAGYGRHFLGHLTSGGTVANLEALWIARELHPDKSIASTAQAHYTHQRMCRVLNTNHITIPILSDGSPDLDFLNEYADQIGTVVVTLGTTGEGEVEPLHVMKPWADKHGIRIHLDAAYGGFFKLIAGEEGIDSNPFQFIDQCDSIVMDPHKHGLQPYGCGSVLFRDPSIGRFYKHDSPYTYFTSDDLHLGEITLECSRAGAAAAALWFTLQLVPLNDEGLGSVLLKCRRAAKQFASGINRSGRFALYKEPALDIVCFFPETEKKSTSEVSRQSQKIFQRLMDRKDEALYLSLYKVSSENFHSLHTDYRMDSEQTVILRSVLMKPEHETYTSILLERLES